MSLIKSFGYHRGLYWRHMITSCDPLTQQMKTCSQCAELLPFSDFGKDACASDGRRATCKSCRRKMSSAWPSKTSLEVQEKNRKQRRERHRRYQENIHQSIGRQLIYYIVNPYDPSLIKIGHSKSISQRFEHFLAVLPQIFLIALDQSENAYEKELELHQRFQNLRHHGEWFFAKAPLLQHIDSLDQSLAHQCTSLLVPSKQKRIIVPDKQHFIDSVPFLGK